MPLLGVRLFKEFVHSAFIPRYDAGACLASRLMRDRSWMMSVQGNGESFHCHLRAALRCTWNPPRRIAIGWTGWRFASWHSMVKLFIDHSAAELHDLDGRLREAVGLGRDRRAAPTWRHRMSLTERLSEMEIDLPCMHGPFGAYVPAKRVGDLIYVAGQLPMKDGKLTAVGPVPSQCSIECATAAARQCVINALCAVRGRGIADSIDWRGPARRVRQFRCWIHRPFDRRQWGKRIPDGTVPRGGPSRPRLGRRHHAAAGIGGGDRIHLPIGATFVLGASPSRTP